MTREEIDVLLEQAFTLAATTNDLHRRYAFANLILEAAAVECDSLEYAFKPGHECAESIRSMKA